MFNPLMGTRASLAGREAIRVVRGENGYVVYGQYAPHGPGRYRVEFDLMLADDVSDGDDPACAELDVSAMKGRVQIAARVLRASDLSSAPRTFILEFTSREHRALEYRVRTTGLRPLVIGDPRLSSLGPVTGAPPVDPRANTSDPVELNPQVRAVLRLLRPWRAQGVDKVRLGGGGAAGFVCLDDFDVGATMLSLWPEEVEDWQGDAAARGLATRSVTPEQLDPVDSQHLLLKLGPAASASDTLTFLASADLVPFAQIVCDLRDLRAIGAGDDRRRLFDTLGRLTATHGLVHVHGDIRHGIANLANVTFPNAIQATFASRARYKLGETDELFPGPLDSSTDPDQPDLFLGAFRF